MAKSRPTVLQASTHVRKTAPSTSSDGSLLERNNCRCDLTLPFTSCAMAMALSSSVLAAASAATTLWLAISASYPAGSAAFRAASSVTCAVARRFAPEDRNAESGLSVSRRLETWPFGGDIGGAGACEGDFVNEGETAAVERGVCAVDVTKSGGEGGDMGG